MYELKTTNTKLANHVKAINKLNATTKKAIFETAARLNIIETEGWAKEEGFKNTAELAAECFGYSRSTTLNYIKIAERYLDVRVDKSKRLDVSTICARRDAEGKVTEDYNIGQLNAIGRLTQETFVQLDREDVIDPSMTQKEIKDAVKAWEKQFLDESDFDEMPHEQEHEQEQEQEHEQEHEQEQATTTEVTAMSLVELIANSIVKLECKVSDNDTAMNTIATIKQYVEQLYTQV